MSILVAGLMAVDTSSNVISATICDVGRIALKDLPTINHNSAFDAYFDDGGPMLKACPKLRQDIPVGLPVAGFDALVRASVHAPTPGKIVRPAFIYWVNLPEVSADLQTATVQMGYSCTGLCGANFVAH
jgi:hypothetical protein